MAAREFGVDIGTLRTRLGAAGAAPGKDGHYSTAQIAAALYGDGKAERAKLVAVATRRAEVKYRKEAGELIELSVVETEWEEHILTVKGKLQGIPAKLSARIRAGLDQAEIRGILQQEVDEILAELSRPPDYSADEPIRAQSPAADAG